MPRTVDCEAVSLELLQVLSLLREYVDHRGLEMPEAPDRRRPRTLIFSSYNAEDTCSCDQVVRAAWGA